MSFDAPYWRPPTPRSIWSLSWEAYGLEARFWIPRGSTDVHEETIRLCEARSELSLLRW